MSRRVYVVAGFAIPDDPEAEFPVSAAVEAMAEQLARFAGVRVFATLDPVDVGRIGVVEARVGRG